MTPERDAPVDLIEHLLRVLRLLHGREHVPRADGVDADRGRPLQGERLGEGHESRLGGVVVGVIAVADQCVGGCRVEDHAAAAQEHAARGRLGYPEGAAQVGGDDLLPLVGGDVDCRAADAHAGVVDQHVQVADLLERGVDLGAVAHVAGDDAGSGASRQDDDIAALIAHALCRRGADTAGATRDHDSLARQTFHAEPPLSPSPARCYRTSLRRGAERLRTNGCF
jgi:hypothetical protein